MTDSTASISGRYFCDDDDDNTEDATDPGVAGVLVILLGADGAIVSDTVTNEDGTYTFDNLEAGEYRVKFSDPDDGKVWVTADAGNDDTDDSDVTNFATGTTDIITVASGEQVTDVDGGIAYGSQVFEVEKAISNFVVYLDTDGEAGDEVTKVKFEFAGEGPNSLTQAQIEEAIALAGYDDAELLGVSVKAGNNGGVYGPGEGQFFDADPSDGFVDGTTETVSLTVESFEFM